MIKFAQLPSKERAPFFEEVASRRGLTELIVEKDFWSCFILNRLFSISELKNIFVFKGGTSLSKAYGIIKRFSEDIDITIHPKWLKYDLDRLPEKGTSKTMCKNYRTELNRACDSKIHEIQAILEENIINKLLPIKSDRKYLEYNNTDSSLVFYYPTKKKDVYGYIRPQIRLEIGSNTGIEPNETREIIPWVAEEFPDAFTEPKSALIVLKPERTFWEKATILHAEYHRPLEKAMRNRLSRDFYDLCLMAKHESGLNAIKNLRILEDVVKHKNTYFYAEWAKYDKAKAGTLCLYPQAARISELKKDYEQMKEMFIENPPSFDNLLSVIRKIENLINKG